MIDIHTHILPFIDDGSKTLEASIELLKEEVSFGVTDVFFTPHYMKRRNYLSSSSKNKEVFQEFSNHVKELGLPICIHLGNEIYYQNDSIGKIRDQIVLPMGDSKYILLEFSTYEEEEDIAEAIHNIKAIGYIPIIAHIERYSYLSMKDYSIIKRMGALIQLNASSVIGESGTALKKICHKLIKDDLVDFVASDIHTFRKNYMKDAFLYVQKKYGDTTAEKLFNNKVILNK